MTFFTTPELLEIGNLQMTSLNDKPNRTEALKYYRRVADHYKLFFFKQKTAYEIGLGIPAEPLFRSMVTLHEVITFLVSMQISISSLQTHNVNRCGRSRHLARKLSLRRKRSSPNVFEMAATETITSIILIKLIRV